MKIAFTTAVFVMLSSCLFAQAPGLEWEKRIGGTDMDEPNCIRPTADSGYIVAGVTKSDDNDVSGNHGAIDFWIVKLDKAGSIEWQKTYGGLYNDRCNSVQQTTDGGYIVCGDSDSAFLKSTALVIKLDDDGEIAWQKYLRDSGLYQATSVCQVNDGGFMIAGRGLAGYGLIKLTNEGEWEWKKKVGGSTDDLINDVYSTGDGGCIATGQVKEFYYRFKVIKLDKNGNTQWENYLDGDFGKSVQQTKDGGFILVGDHYVFGEESGSLLIKLGAGGAIEWQRLLVDANVTKNICQTFDGGYITSYFTYWNDGESDYQSNSYVRKLDSNGNDEWTFHIRWFLFTAPYNLYVQQCLDGDFILATTYNDVSFPGVVTPAYDQDDYHILKITMGSIINLCPLGSAVFTSNFTAPSYQWTVAEEGSSSFYWVTNDGNHSGASTSTLSLTNLPTSFSGRHYRCLANGKATRVYTIRFAGKWTGNAGTEWENALNWSCGVVPDANTDVQIDNGVVFLNSSTSCRSLKANSLSTLTVKPGKNLTITH